MRMSAYASTEITILVDGGFFEHNLKPIVSMFFKFCPSFSFFWFSVSPVIVYSLNLDESDMFQEPSSALGCKFCADSYASYLHR